VFCQIDSQFLNLFELTLFFLLWFLGRKMKVQRTMTNRIRVFSLNAIIFKFL